MLPNRFQPATDFSIDLTSPSAGRVFNMIGTFDQLEAYLAKAQARA
jgi:hypothetical protein